MEKAEFVTAQDRWIGKFNELYWKIVKDPDIPVGNLDKANEVICEAIEKLRPLAKTYHDEQAVH